MRSVRPPSRPSYVAAFVKRGSARCRTVPGPRPASTRADSPGAGTRCSWSWLWGGPTTRSPSACSSRPRPSTITCRPCSPSWEWKPARRCRRGGTAGPARAIWGARGRNLGNDSRSGTHPADLASRETPEGVTDAALHGCSPDRRRRVDRRHRQGTRCGPRSSGQLTSRSGRVLATLASCAVLVAGAGTVAAAHDGSGHQASGEDQFHEGASRLDRLRFATAPWLRTRQGRQPLWAAALPRAARVGLAAQPQWDVRGLESRRHLRARTVTD